jgi:hypothetical protein
MNSFEKINKVFIISSGRTGTEFFGENIKKLSPNFLSIHEPDRISIEKRRLNQAFGRLLKQGFFNQIILKSLGIFGTRNLSLKNIKEKQHEAKIISQLTNERNWLNFNSKTVYIESNWQLFGLIDILPNIKPQTKIIFIFRDPRSWVSSWMNHKGWYSKADLLTLIDKKGFKRVTPANVGIDNPKWKDYSRFQKLCWVWNYMNGNFYETVKENNPNIRHFFFEDIFVKQDKTTIKDFLQFSLNEYFKDEYVEQMLSMLQHKVNQKPKEDFPNWIDWDKKHCQDLHYFCGDLMKELGYGTEPEWLKKIE